MTINLKEEYYAAQMKKLNDHEQDHLAEPSKSALLWAVSLSVVEGGAAFALLLEAGLLIAVIGALLPVCLLWALANMHADHAELPEKLDDLMEQYNDSIQS